MNPVAFRATIINIGANSVLFAMKLAAGLTTGSIALISEALNSLSDIAASVATFICVRISAKEADEGHPFGHSRAEPIAGLIIAVLAGIVGFEVIRASVERLISGETPEISPYALAVPVVTMISKGLMSWHFIRVGRLFKSPAIRATALDCLMDVFLAGAALAGIAGAWRGHYYLDPAAGLVISVWIIYTGYRIGLENIAYLMGSAPDPSLMEEIKSATLAVPGVRDINTVRAHYVGHFIHVEIHIEVDRDLSTSLSHGIGEEVERRLESIPVVDKAFVHIDPA